MNNASIRIYEMLVLALGGAVFSGYLSAVKLFSAGCVLTAPCPFFLGYPACYFGFAMFAALTVLVFLWAIGMPMRRWVLALSAIGALFAAYFTAHEWEALVALFSNFSLLAIPSCVVGLVVYVAVLWLAVAEH